MGRGFGKQNVFVRGGGGWLVGYAVAHTRFLLFPRVKESHDGYPLLMLASLFACFSAHRRAEAAVCEVRRKEQGWGMSLPPPLLPPTSPPPLPPRTPTKRSEA